MTVAGLRKKVDTIKVRKEFLEQDIQLYKKEKGKRTEYSARLLRAKWILSEASIRTQQAFAQNVEALVTPAIQAVFDDRAFRFIAKYEIKRNKPECRLLVQDGDKLPYVPKTATGCGLLDIISIPLRIVLWKLSNPRSRPVFLLDEPLRDVGEDKGMLIKAGKFLREISDRMGIQFIINTHERKLIEIADKAWEVEHDGTKSFVNLMENQGQ